MISIMNNDSKNKSFVTIRVAEKITGIGQKTLRKYADQNEIECYRTPSGQRMFSITGLQVLTTNNSNDTTIPEVLKENFLYARVSSRKQMDDLGRQIEYLKHYEPEYINFTTLEDIGSGINFKRKGLQTLLDKCLHGTIGTVVVAHRDRLSRFGFDLIKTIIEKAGGNIVVIDDTKSKSSEQELAEDLMSIVHIYSCRQMGKRSYTAQRIKDIENIDKTNGDTEERNETLVSHL